MLPSDWRPRPVKEAVRLGRRGDGGYVVSKHMLHDSQLLISMGLGADWSFEQAFLACAPRGRVVCFDHTVTPRWWIEFTLKRLLTLQFHRVFDYLRYRRFFGRPDVEHRRVKVGYPGHEAVSLDRIFDEFDAEQVFLKVDIEGWEYRILDQIIEHQSRLRGLVVEFHDVDLHRARIDEFFREMSSLTIVWMHGNNYGGSDADGDPIVLEVTMAPSAAVAAAATDDLQRLTYPNDPGSPEIPLNYQ